ncbi:CheY chemotaxis protein or a CheY-like REC (receiver) domain [Spirosomataceae bacterium TFI 002]|nr:CheY chemotaxis protein or a CheY-like REC (receiver) domain [Spirosomataceae bacterium TFI 002]
MKSIFLAEDDPDDREFFKEALEQLNFDTELTFSNNGVELMSCLEVLVRHPPPHVIFLDLNMPMKNGFQCLEEIRNTPKLRDIPVVIFSTTGDIDSVDKTYNQGANYYICKPNSFQLLVKAIEKVLSLDLIQAPRAVKENYILSIA